MPRASNIKTVNSGEPEFDAHAESIRYTFSFDYGKAYRLFPKIRKLYYTIGFSYTFKELFMIK